MLIQVETVPPGLDTTLWHPPAEVAALAELLRVLADPRRLVLVRLLAERETCVCEFGERLGWPQNLISHHLGALRRAGLVQARREAQWVYYSLVPEAFDRTRGLLRQVLGAETLPPEAQYGAAPRRCAP